MNKPKQPTLLDKVIAKKIKFYRLQKGYTIKQLAEKVGVTYQQLQKYESGKSRISASRLKQIAKVLGVPITEFYNSKNLKNNNHLKRAGIIYKNSTPEKRKLLDKILSFLDKIL